MRTTGCWVTGLFFLLTISTHAQAPVTAAAARVVAGAAAKADTPSWQVKQRGEHQTEWFSVRYQTNAGTGKVRATTNSYVELGTGLNYYDPATQRWEESREEIEIVNGVGVAQKGQHKVMFAANINSAAAIQTTVRDGKELKSHVLGLAYTDAATGQSVLIAGIRDSIGEVAGNQVIYRDAFDGAFKADVRYTYTKGGFEQDVILRESPPAPEKFGLNSETARLEVWTEFVQPPEPVKTEAALKQETDPLVRQAMVDPDLTDETLDFGAMKIGAGNAFPAESAPGDLDRANVPVGKNWLRIEGRQFLIEKADYEDIQPNLDELPKPVEALPGKKQASVTPQPRREWLAALKPPTRQQASARIDRSVMQLAAVSSPGKGYVIDYSLVSSQPNMVFKGHETYHVTSPVALTGTTVIEGGTVVKFNNGTYLTVSGGINCRTEPYRPAFFTARDDNSVGEIVSGSTGVPSGYYAGYIFYLNDATTSYDLHNLRLRYANQALFRNISGSGGATITLRHSQIQDCNRAFGVYYSPTTLRNVLVYRTMVGFYSTVANYGENVTFHRIKQLVTGPSQPPLQLKNTLLISCTNNSAAGVAYVADLTVIKPGTLEDAGIFETSALGHHYLPANSDYRGAGTANINATLLSDLKQTTTRAPIILSGTLAQNKTLGPDVPRNSSVTPDLGYAYFAMDYLSQNYVVQGSAGSPVTLLITNGAIVGMDPTVGPAGGGRYGIQFGAYSKLASVGAPDKLNRLLPIQTIQENGPGAANWPGYFGTLHGAGLSGYPNAFLRFTDLTLFAGTVHKHLSDFGGFMKLTLQDSQVRGGLYYGFYLGFDTPGHSVTLTNTLFENVQFTYHPYAAGSFHARNNLFKGGTLIMDMNPVGAPAWTFYDNLFDGTVISQAGGPGVENNYNAYVTAQTSTRLTPAVAAPNNFDKTLTASPTYEVGVFGSNYLASTATQLINQGSRTAAAASLYHYTTSKDLDTKEGNTQVDIGLHYVGAGGINDPLDADVDGFADYYEDRNGNGLHEMTQGERRWQGIPVEPVIKFSAAPLEYYPDAGLIILDPSVTVTDNHPDDENFLFVTNLTIETVAGDFIRLLPIPGVLAIQSVDQVFLNGTQIARMTGGDGLLPLRFDFRVNGQNGASLIQVQTLLRLLNYIGHTDSGGQEVARSAKAVVTDGLGVSSSSSRQIRILPDRPLPIVNAGPDISLFENNLALNLTGYFTSTVNNARITAEWLLVEPVYLWHPEDPFIAGFPPYGGPLGYISDYLPAQPSAPVNYDLFHQSTAFELESRGNPRKTVTLPRGESDSLNLSINLPVPAYEFDLGPYLPDDYVARKYRFQLRISDGNRTVIDEVGVRIFPPGSLSSPEVTITSVPTKRPGQVFSLGASVYNEPNETLTYLWEIQAFPGVVHGTEWSLGNGVYQSQVAHPTLSVSTPGQFQAALTVTDSSGRSASATTRLKICDQPETPADIMIVADNSDSIWGQALTDVESAVTFMAQNSKFDLHQFGLISFYNVGFMEQPLTRDSQAVISSIRGIKYHAAQASIGNSSASRAGHALNLAFTALANDPNRNPMAEGVIVFLTDGFLADQNEVRQIANLIKNSGLRLVTIYARHPWIPENTAITSFMKSIASSSEDAHVAQSSGITGIMADIVTRNCASEIEPPILNLGQDRSVEIGQTAALSPLLNYSGDLAALTYTWEQISPGSPLASINQGSDGQAQISFSQDGEYVFRLTVTEPNGRTVSGEITITVRHGAESKYTVLMAIYGRKESEHEITSCPPTGANPSGWTLQGSAPIPTPPPPPGAVNWSWIGTCLPMHECWQRITGSGGNEIVCILRRYCQFIPPFAQYNSVPPRYPRLQTFIPPSPVNNHFRFVYPPLEPLPFGHVFLQQPPGGNIVNATPSSPIPNSYQPGPYSCVSGGHDEILPPPEMGVVELEVTKTADGSTSTKVVRWLSMDKIWSPLNQNAEIRMPHNCSEKGMASIFMYPQLYWPTYIEPANLMNAGCGDLCNSWFLVDQPAKLFGEVAVQDIERHAQANRVTHALSFVTTQITPQTIPWDLNAGGDQMALIPQGNPCATVQLRGKLVHRLPKPLLPQSVQWSLISKPAGSTMTFAPGATASTLATTVCFDQPGNYVLKLEVSGNSPACEANGAAVPHVVSDLVSIKIGYGLVDAGPDQIVELPDSPLLLFELFTLAGATSGNVGSIEWHIEKEPDSISSPAIIPAQNSLVTTVLGSANGVYQFRLSSENGGSDIVQVQVNKRPEFGYNAIWSPSWTTFGEDGNPAFQLGKNEANELGLQLVADATDDGLPLGSRLTYVWKCTSAPADGICEFSNPYSQSTWVDFSKEGNYDIEVTVSDGHLSTVSSTETIKVRKMPEPVLTFEIPANSRGNRLDLFPEQTPWRRAGLKLSEVVSTSLWLVSGGSEVQPTPLEPQLGIFSIQDNGRSLRYTPRIQLSDCTTRGREELYVKFRDRRGQERDGRIIIHIVPASPSKEEYEREHVFKFVFRADEVSFASPIRINLREYLATCATPNQNQSIFGDPNLLPRMDLAGSTHFSTVNASVGRFYRSHDLWNLAPFDLLIFEARANYDGDVPLTSSLFFQMDGMPGQARFDFVLLKRNAPMEPMADLGSEELIELGQPLRVRTYGRPTTLSGNMNSANSFAYTWQAFTLDGNPASASFAAVPSADDSSKDVTFASLGTFVVRVTATSGTPPNQQTAVSETKVIVVPVGSLTDPGQSTGPYDDPAEEVEGVPPAVLLTKPGRAVILNLPDPRPGVPPFEIKDGRLNMRGQAAAPVDADPADGIICDLPPYSCEDAAYRVFLYHAGYGEEVPPGVDDSANAIDLTPTLEFDSSRQLNIQANGSLTDWNLQLVSGQPGNDEIGAVDLSGFTNGNYFVQLWVKGRLDMGNGTIQETAIGKSRKYPILLNTERKPGKVQFSETDFNLAAADGRLRVSRSYDSEMGPPSGSGPTSETPELGWGWSLSSFDLGVQLYEYRADIEEDALSMLLKDDPEIGTPGSRNIRVKGAHHVTLNLPWNGRRVTFQQSIGSNRLPYWETPEGESGQLDAPLEERHAFASLDAGVNVQWFGSLSHYSRSQEQFDFSQFTLTGPDGTKYYLTRGNPDIVTWSAWRDDPMGGEIYPNPPALTKVEFPDGATMERTYSGAEEILKYYPTRAVPGVSQTPITITVVRETQGVLAGKIKEIRSSQSPAGTADTRPAVKYIYYQQADLDGQGGTLPAGDKRIGNLKEVKRLTRTTAGNDTDYDVTTYYYKSSGFAHLIHHVVNPLRLKSFEAGWNGDGQLIWTKDAAGIQRTVSNSSTDGTLPAPDGRAYTDTSTVELPLGNEPVQNYNSGTSPKVKTITRSDSFGNVIQTTVQVDNGPVLATTTRKFEETKLTSSTDAEGRTTGLFYDADGRLEETRRPGGTVERIGYDELGMPSTVSDARRNVSSTLTIDGRPVESRDAKQNVTTIAYIETGELKGKIDYIKDALGNRTYTTYYKTGDTDLGDNPLGSVRETFLLEKPTTGDFNLTDTTLRRNWTKSIYYKNGLLKESTSTRTGRNSTGGNETFTIKTAYEYDAQGRVTKTKQYPSNNPFTPVDESAALHVTTQTYNALGKVETSTDKYGRVTSYYYDQRGNLTQTLYPDNTITRTVYDVNNRPIYQQAAHPAPGTFTASTTSFGTHTEYDAFGRAVKTEKLSAIAVSLVSVQNVDNQTVSGLYAAQLGSVGSVLDSTTTEYDAIGRVKKVIDVTGAYRRFVYVDANPGVPAAGNTPAVPASLASKLTYAGSGATEILVAEEQYDAGGNVVISRTFDRDTNADPQTASYSSFEYDELNRQTKQTVHNLDGSVYSTSTTIYDALGRRTQTTDADSKVTDFAYDGAGRLRSVTEWLVEGATRTPVVTEYTYDEAGNLIVQKDALGRETKYEYDNFGRRIRRTLPGTQTETLAYDVFSLSQLLDGNNKLVQRDYRTDFNNQTTRRNYDSRGRLIWKGTGDGVTPLAQFTYTPWGARQTMVDPSGTTTYIYGRVGSYTGNPIPGTFTYDSDQLIVKQRANPGAPASTDAFLYEHDAAGNLKRVNTKYTFTLSGSSITAVSAPDTTRTDVRYEYDFQNRLTKVRRGSDSAELASYDYSDPGVLEQTTFSTSQALHHTYDYNAANQLRNVIIDQNGTQIRKFDYNPAGHELAKSGQRKAAWEYGAPNSIRRKVNYTQDSLQRLVAEQIETDNTVPTDIGTVSYAYDKVGNRLSRQTASTALALKIPNFALPNGTSHDVNDRLPAPEVYDNNGNTLKGDIDGVAGVEQPVNDVYDLEDRLTTSARTGKTVTLAYDGDGNRTRKDVTVGGTTTATRYVVDDRTPSGYAQVMEEWQSVNGGAWSLARKYTYGLSRIRQERLSGGAVVGTEYYGYDGHGNVVLLVDGATGAVGNTYSYDAYGVLLSQGGSTPNHYQYSGEQWDSDLGMYYLRARYMNPQSGRFWTMDTFEGNSSTPLSLHKYLYAHANPVNGIDPTGHEFSVVAMTIASASATVLQTTYDAAVVGTGFVIQERLLEALKQVTVSELWAEALLSGESIAMEDALGYVADRLKSFGVADGDAEAYAFRGYFDFALLPLLVEDEDYVTTELDDQEPQCFEAGTLVQTAEGPKKIEEIRRGDRVWAYDTAKNVTVLKTVLRTFTRERDAIIRLQIDQEDIDVTPEHPFFVKNRGWTRADQLLLGDFLLTLDAENSARVQRVEKKAGKFVVYNFEVEELHDYFVGDEAVLVHNVGRGYHHHATKGLGSKIPYRAPILQKSNELNAYEHSALHKNLNSYLKTIVDPKTGKHMMPCRGNPGTAVRNNFSKHQRLFALKNFYKTYQDGKYYPAFRREVTYLRQNRSLFQ